jgi:hypothetical protein
MMKRRRKREVDMEEEERIDWMELRWAWRR